MAIFKKQANAPFVSAEIFTGNNYEAIEKLLNHNNFDIVVATIKDEEIGVLVVEYFDKDENVKYLAVPQDSYIVINDKGKMNVIDSDKFESTYLFVSDN
ncbi:MAG: hypothetical protein ACRC92_21875 [Peptostreptococcaceae bacterium]